MQLPPPSFFPFPARQSQCGIIWKLFAFARAHGRKCVPLSRHCLRLVTLFFVGQTSFCFGGLISFSSHRSPGLLRTRTLARITFAGAPLFGRGTPICAFPTFFLSLLFFSPVFIFYRGSSVDSTVLRFVCLRIFFSRK